MNQTIYDKTDEFFNKYPLIRLHKGQTLLVDEDEIQDIFWMRRGMIRLYQISDEGNDITLHLFKAPSFFPMMFYLSHRKADYHFQAVDEVIARKAPAEDVVVFLKQNPDILFDLTSRFADAITGLLVRIEQLSSQNAYERVCSVLLYLAEKFGELDGNECVITIKLSHEDLAGWVGVVRETVSHQIERLTKDGIIASRNRQFIILDMDRLKKHS
jgi:CRP/FNR family cyclic AMP-dependent transcriptional regulator